MKKITISAILVLISTFSFAATGWFSDFLTISANGTSTPNNYFLTDATPASGATALHGKAFGLVTSLEITGADMKYWSDTQDRTGAAFYYKITNATNTFDFVYATEIILDQVFLSANDYQGTKTTTINLLTGLPSGSYQLHVWAKSWGSGQGDSWLSNNSANYVATFMKMPASTTPMSGTYKVGDAGNADFNSLSAAVNAANSFGVGGNVVFEIATNLTETANIGLGVNTNGFSVTIRPDLDADRTITFTQLSDNSSPTGHFVIGYPSSGLSVAWSDANTIATSNVTIDGFAAGGATKRLKFTNTNANHIGARVISIIGACQNTVIKNCIVENKTTNTSSPVCIVAVVRKGTAIEVAPTNITLDNNTLIATASGVSMGMRITNSGTLVAIPKIAGFIFKNNTVTAARRLLELSYLTGNSDINNNTFNLVQNTAPGALVYGIFGNLNLLGTINLYNNKFNQSTVTESAASGTFGLRLLQLASGPTSWNIYNNTFSGMNRTQTAGAATLNLSYIQVSFGTANIYHNTFYLPALTSPAALGYYNAINNSNAQNAQKIRNNIFILDEPTAACAFVSNVCVSPGESENNVYYNRQITNTNAKVVATYSDLGSYQLANGTLDINSRSGNVNFENAATGDLRIAGLSVQDNLLRMPSISTVTNDIVGTLRNTEYTYAGAHESTLPFLTTEVDNAKATPARILRTSSGIEVQLDREANVELYTINGMLIDNARVNGTYSHNLNAGIYIIRIDGKATKFVK